MGEETGPAGPDTLDTALEMMERALINLKALGKDHAADQLYDALDTAMDDPEDCPRQGEIWEVVSEFPHIVGRTFLLHRRDGLSIERVARRLGITVDDAKAHLSFAQHEVSTPRPG